MRILNFSLKLILLAMVAILVIPACKDDEPETAKIHGTIKFDNVQLWDTWKDSGDVIVSIFPKFVLALPPAGAGWGDVPDDFYAPGVPGGRYAIGAPSASVELTYVPGQTEYDYSFEVAPGEYSALAVGFRHDRISDPSLKTATLGVHWDHPNEVSHGIVLKIDVGGGQVITLFNDPAPSTITVDKGDDVELNFRADFAFVTQWYH